MTAPSHRPGGRPRRSRHVAGALLLGAVALAGCDRWVSQPVSVDPQGTTGNGESRDAVFSPDGTKVAFVSRATDLGPTDGNGRTDVYVHDLVTGETTLASANAAGTDSGNERSGSPSFSPDGTAVLFESLASDLGPADGNTGYDVYIRDLTNEVTTLVSASAGGGAAGGFDPTFSPDGSKVAFVSSGETFGPNDTNHTFDIYVRDLATAATTLVSVNRAGTDGGNSQSVEPAFSPDGRKVAFSSQASDLDPDVLNWKLGSDVYYRDLAGGFTVTLSTDATRTEDASGSSSSPVWSPDSSKVLFYSNADDMGRPDPDDATDLYLRDIRTGGIWRLPLGVPPFSDGEPPPDVPGTRRGPSFSPDGTRIAFVSWDDHLVPGDVNPGADAYIYTLASGQFRRVLGGTNGRAYDPVFDAGGTRVLFLATATDVAGPDANGAQPDVVVYDTTTSTTVRVSSLQTGAAANGASYDARFSPTDGRVLFTSAASDLVRGDTNGVPDVFVARFVTDADAGGAAPASVSS